MSLGPGRSGRRNGPQVEQRNWTKGSKNTWATHNVLDKMPHTRVGKGALLRAVPPGYAGGGHASLCPPLYGGFCQERCVLPKDFLVLWASFFVCPGGRFSLPTRLGPRASRADARQECRRPAAATPAAVERRPCT